MNYRHVILRTRWWLEALTGSRRTRVTILVRGGTVTIARIERRGTTFYQVMDDGRAVAALSEASIALAAGWDLMQRRRAEELALVGGSQKGALSREPS
jgi:hypothetical protein